MPGMTKSFFDKKKGKWILTAQDAADWTPGPCVVWEITGQCPLGDKCTCAHLDRDALNAKNQRNKLGNYVEATMPARCKYVLKQIKSGAWSNMKGAKADAPCLVELLAWLPAQNGGEIDVDIVQSFISANKTAPEEELTEEEVAFIEECYQEVLDGETNLPGTDEDDVDAEFAEFQAEEQVQNDMIDAFHWAFLTIAWMNDRDIMQQNEAQLQMLRAEEQRLMEVCAQEVAAKAARSFAAVCRTPVARAVKRVLVDDMDDYEWEGMVEEARTSSLM